MFKREAESNWAYCQVLNHMDLYLKFLVWSSCSRTMFMILVLPLPHSPWMAIVNGVSQLFIKLASPFI